MRTGLAPTLTGSSLFSFQGTGAVQRRIPSLSQATLEVKSFFRDRPEAGFRQKALSDFSRVLLAGKIGPGHRRGRGRYGSCPGMSSVNLRGIEKRRAGDRTARSPGGMTPGEGDPVSRTVDRLRREERARSRASDGT